MAAAVILLAAVPARAPAAGIDLVRPVRGAIVRHFEQPPTPFAAGHRGIDMAVPAGTTVVAAAAGMVAFAGAVAGELFVSIDHPEGLRTTYSFLSAVLVRAGEPVAQGSPVARSGPCHAGADPCLHFGLRSGPDYLDPEPHLADHLRRNVWEAIRLTA